MTRVYPLPGKLPLLVEYAVELINENQSNPLFNQDIISDPPE